VDQPEQEKIAKGLLEIYLDVWADKDDVRSKLESNPKEVLADHGIDLGEDVTVQVHLFDRPQVSQEEDESLQDFFLGWERGVSNNYIELWMLLPSDGGLMYCSPMTPTMFCLGGMFCRMFC
jgi:hypothetical protein